MRVRTIELSDPWKPMKIDIYINNNDNREYISYATMLQMTGKSKKILQGYLYNRFDIFPQWIGSHRIRLLVDVQDIPAILESSDLNIEKAMTFFNSTNNNNNNSIIEDVVERHAKRIAEELRESIFSDKVLIEKYEKELRASIFSDKARIKRYEIESEIQIKANVLKRLRNE